MIPLRRSSSPSSRLRAPPPGGRATVTLRFSKPVALPGTALQIFYGATKASVTGTFSKDFRSVSFNLQPPPNSRVTIAGSSDIRDNADNPLEPFRPRIRHRRECRDGIAHGPTD